MGPSLGSCSEFLKVTSEPAGALWVQLTHDALNASRATCLGEKFGGRARFQNEMTHLPQFTPQRSQCAFLNGSLTSWTSNNPGISHKPLDWLSMFQFICVLQWGKYMLYFVTILLPGLSAAPTCFWKIWTFTRGLKSFRRGRCQRMFHQWQGLLLHAAFPSRIPPPTCCSIENPCNHGAKEKRRIWKNYKTARCDLMQWVLGPAETQQSPCKWQSCSVETHSLCENPLATRRIETSSGECKSLSFCNSWRIQRNDFRASAHVSSLHEWTVESDRTYLLRVWCHSRVAEGRATMEWHSCRNKIKQPQISRLDFPVLHAHHWDSPCRDVVSNPERLADNQWVWRQLHRRLDDIRHLLGNIAIDHRCRKQWPNFRILPSRWFAEIIFALDPEDRHLLGEYALGCLGHVSVTLFLQTSCDPFDPQMFWKQR